MAWMNASAWEPSASLAFPVQDGIVLDDRAQLNFLSLLGAMSPLPHYLTLVAIESPAFYAFVAVLNRVFYHAFVTAWKAAHMIAPLPCARPVVSPSLLGLRALLQSLCPEISVEVTIKSGYRNIERAKDLRLSDNAVLGTRILIHPARLEIKVHQVLSDVLRDTLQSTARAYVGDLLLIRFVFVVPCMTTTYLSHRGCVLRSF